MFKCQHSEPIKIQFSNSIFLYDFDIVIFRKIFNKTMKLLINLGIFFLLNTVNIFSDNTDYWFHVPSPTFATLYRCCFTDTLNGWAAGDSGTIVHTSDGGVNWVTQSSTIDFSIQDLFFANPRLGWAIANDFFYSGTMILRTTNGGVTWSGARYPDTTYIINTVYFTDSLNGYLAGFNRLILKTTDGGTTWNRVNIFENFYSVLPIKKISFLNSNYGIACGGTMDIAGIVWRTTDSGFNWSVMDTTSETLFDVRYIDSLNVIACGGDFEYGAIFSRSRDGGITWQNSTIGYFGLPKALAVRSRSEFWIPLSYSLDWMLSLDSGNTWTVLPTPDSSSIFDALFIDFNHGWAFGQNGTILKYDPLIGTGNNHNHVPTQIELYQNFPNPFNSATTIEYNLSESGKVKLILYDVLGKQVSVLVNSFQKQGKNRIYFDGNGLCSGIYFYCLLAADHLLTKKMVVLK